MFETILFSWIFGMDKGWREITSGADIKVPNIYKFIIKYITPVTDNHFLRFFIQTLRNNGLEMFLAF
jgi:SNF family Na+-dependent transporter